MGISPWSVAPEIGCWEASCILAGYEPSEVEGLLNNAPEFEYQVADVFAWNHQIVWAIGRGSLKTESLMVYRLPKDGEVGDPKKMRWLPEPSEDVEIWLTIIGPEEIKARIQKAEIYRWLKASGIADADIPEALRVIPGQEAPANQPQAQTVEADELRTLEALGLLVETFAKQEAHTHKYRIGEAGRPNCAQIAKAMNNQAGDVYGMSESKLQRLLSKALTTWQEKCK